MLVEVEVEVEVEDEEEVLVLVDVPSGGRDVLVLDVLSMVAALVCAVVAAVAFAEVLEASPREPSCPALPPRLSSVDEPSAGARTKAMVTTEATIAMTVMTSTSWRVADGGPIRRIFEAKKRNTLVPTAHEPASMGRSLSKANARVSSSRPEAASWSMSSPGGVCGPRWFWPADWSPLVCPFESTAMYAPDPSLAMGASCIIVGFS